MVELKKILGFFFFTSDLSWLKGKYCFEVTARISALSHFKVVAEQLTPGSGSV